MSRSSENVTLPSAGAEQPSLSVVVIGRNEEQNLARCIESIKQIRGVSVNELIYVDSASSDGSPQLAEKLGAAVLVVHPDRPSAALGRNAGWRRTTSDIILFLDGDTILDPDFPRIAYQTMSQQPSVAAVWGHRREIHPEASIYNSVLDLDWIYPAGPSEFCGGDVLMRRCVLDEVDGFDERLIAGEEPELCRRIRALNYSILHIDHPMTGHDLQITRFRQYWRRATRAGHAYAEVSERFRNSEDAFWDAARRGNILRAGFWLISLALSLAASFWFSPYCIAIWILILLAFSIKSAWKARWKKAAPLTLLLYGLHSHLQQLPIFVGQCQYSIGKRSKSRRHLIEYKDVRIGRQPPSSTLP
jgi:glycosyltransferase involved in cell wall biosynthesis